MAAGVTALKCWSNCVTLAKSIEISFAIRRSLLRLVKRKLFSRKSQESLISLLFQASSATFLHSKLVVILGTRPRLGQRGYRFLACLSVHSVTLFANVCWLLCLAGLVGLSSLHACGGLCEES